MMAPSRIRNALAFMFSNEYSPSSGPLDRHGLLRRSWPFLLTVVFAALTLALPERQIVNEGAIAIAVILAVTLAIAAIAVPWRRLPVWSQAAIPLAGLAVVVVIREGTGAAPGYAVLVMLPVLWLALYGTWWQMVTAVVLSGCVFLLPVLIVGPPTYPSNGIGRLLLWPVTAALVGATTYRLVAAERARTAFSRGVLSAATEQAIVATDPNGLITAFNVGAERMLGYTETELVGRATPLVLHDPDELAARAAERGVQPGFELLTERALRGEAETREWIFRTRNGERRWVNLSMSAIRGRAGELQGFVGVGTDVTERRATEAMREEFVALVSHELRTPLASIIGYLEVLFDDDEAGSLTSRQRQFLEVVDRSARRQLRLVGELLFVSQLDSRGLRLDIEDVELTATARAAIERSVPQASAAGVSVHLHDCEPVRLEADEYRIGQIFDNLLNNAAKFTPAGGRVDVRLSAVDDHVTIEVADNGVGIPDVEQRKLFTRFYRASNAAQLSIHGIGLGLTIVKAIVDAHNGDIEITSTEGSGTTFRVELPRRRIEETVSTGP